MKKAQMQILESVAIIIFFSIAMIIAIVFIVKQNARSQEIELSKKANEDVINLAKKIQNMPELKCSIYGTESVGCLDIEKIKAFHNEISKNMFAMNYYKNIFEYSSVKVKVIYAYSDSELKNYTIYENTGNYTYGLFFAIPVQLYNPLNKKNMIGLLEVKYFSPGLQ